MNIGESCVIEKESNFRKRRSKTDNSYTQLAGVMTWQACGNADGERSVQPLMLLYLSRSWTEGAVCATTCSTLIMALLNRCELDPIAYKLIPALVLLYYQQINIKK